MIQFIINSQEGIKLRDIITLPNTDKRDGFVLCTNTDIYRMPDDDLDNHIRWAYDRWNWDTGSDHDKKLLDILEKERKQRTTEGVRVERVKTTQGTSTIRRVVVE